MGTIVLVPGAWLGAWAWKNVTPLLEAQGHHVFPVTLTGEGDRVHLLSKQVGMETAIQDVLNVIEFNDLEDIVLVGHSFAGKVVASVADRAPKKVGTVVYLDAIRPAKSRKPQYGFTPDFPTRGFGVPFPKTLLKTAGRDITGASLKWFMSKVTPVPAHYFSDPIRLSSRFDRVKSGYVFCTQSGDPVDEIIAGKWGKLEGPHRVIDSGHWPMITKPEETAVGVLLVGGL